MNDFFSLKYSFFAAFHDVAFRRRGLFFTSLYARRSPSILVQSCKSEPLVSAVFVSKNLNCCLSAQPIAFSSRGSFFAGEVSFSPVSTLAGLHQSGSFSQVRELRQCCFRQQKIKLLYLSLSEQLKHNRWQTYLPNCEAKVHLLNSALSSCSHAKLQLLTTGFLAVKDAILVQHLHVLRLT